MKRSPAWHQGPAGSGDDIPTIAFVTIGQAPRSDLVPEIRNRIVESHRAMELGLLDGLQPEALSGLAPGPDEARLVTRLADGSEAVLRATWVHDQLPDALRAAADRGADLVVLLCTGHFDTPCLPVPVVRAQAVVDHGTLALAQPGATLGIMVPHAEQARAVERGRPGPAGLPRELLADRHIVATHSSPYSDPRFEDAARELASTDLIVMHCMGYDEAMRAEVRDVSGVPVLLARRMVAAAVQQLL